MGTADQIMHVPSNAMSPTPDVSYIVLELELWSLMQRNDTRYTAMNGNGEDEAAATCSFGQATDRARELYTRTPSQSTPEIDFCPHVLPRG